MHVGNTVLITYFHHGQNDDIPFFDSVHAFAFIVHLTKADYYIFQATVTVGKGKEGFGMVSGLDYNIGK